jgi:hypothetical protein
MAQVARHPDIEAVVTGIVGCAGLLPTGALVCCSLRATAACCPRRPLLHPRARCTTHGTHPAHTHTHTHSHTSRTRHRRTSRCHQGGQGHLPRQQGDAHCWRALCAPARAAARRPHPASRQRAQRHLPGHAGAARGRAAQVGHGALCVCERDCVSGCVCVCGVCALVRVGASHEHACWLRCVDTRSGACVRQPPSNQ